MGVTYRARLLGRGGYSIVFTRDGGGIHPLLATSNADGSFDIWETQSRAAGPDGTVSYNRIAVGVTNRGSAYLA
ncbi:MAG: hypothetical protein EPO52_01485 [Herbiconiux sp.]|uniref:hypothetical protein n=1 Tax=Herbiconiux sp. TaxID=1871186 RepID=UPI00121417B1|nr:hypothetical protein [Herbiconiux sp.]TAJ49659.1 MAG: hypothetical protein EPO52_01485 [Herbiconiux sp.]